jgi:SAM-dependent methyltransferase
MGWTGYLREFHGARPGITEDVLRRCVLDGRTPYDWLLEAVPPEGRTLDLACGNTPLHRRLADRPYVGIDTSAAELAAARQAGARSLVRASGTAIPLAAGTVDVVVCSMALMVLTPLPKAIAEIGRVLVPGGVLVAIVPARGPLRPMDVPIVTGLMAALGRRLDYPADLQLRPLGELLGQAGLRLESDQRRRYGYPLRGAEDADLFLSSLYLPGLRAVHYRAGRRYLRGLARVRAELPVPIRRVIARRRPGGRWGPSAEQAVY